MLDIKVFENLNKLYDEMEKEKNEKPETETEPVSDSIYSLLILLLLFMFSNRESVINYYFITNKDCKCDNK